MRKSSLLFLFSALLLGGGAVLWPTLFPSPLDRFVLACEEVLKDRLRSPATYTRVSVDHFPLAEQTLDQFLSFDTEDERRVYMDRVRSNSDARYAYENLVDYFEAIHPKRLQAFITYDAANAYGTPVRGIADCTTSIRSEKDLATHHFLDVSIDGQTALTWAIRSSQ